MQLAWSFLDLTVSMSITGNVFFQDFYSFITRQRYFCLSFLAFITM